MSESDRIAEFKEVLELMPEDPVVHFGLAGAYLEAGEAASAAAEYQEAVRLKPESAPAREQLQRLLTARNR